MDSLKGTTMNVVDGETSSSDFDLNIKLKNFKKRFITEEEEDASSDAEIIRVDRGRNIIIITDTDSDGIHSNQESDWSYDSESYTASDSDWVPKYKVKSINMKCDPDFEVQSDVRSDQGHEGVTEQESIKLKVQYFSYEKVLNQMWKCALRYKRLHWYYVECLVERAVKVFDFNINSVLKGTSTLLVQACLCGSIEMVKTLLEYDADPNLGLYEYGMFPLSIACQKGRVTIAKHLLINGADPNRYDFTYHQYPIHLACRAQAVNIVKMLIDSNVNLSEKDEDGINALQIALSSQKMSLIDIVIDTLAETEPINDIFYEAMIKSTEYCTEDIIGKFELMKAKIDPEDPENRKIWMGVCRCSNLYLFDYLVQKCDILDLICDAEFSKGLLWIAVSGNHSEIIIKLINNLGIEIDVVGKCSDPLHLIYMDKKFPRRFEILTIPRLMKRTTEWVIKYVDYELLKGLLVMGIDENQILENLSAMQSESGTIRSLIFSLKEGLID